MFVFRVLEVVTVATLGSINESLDLPNITVLRHHTIMFVLFSGKLKASVKKIRHCILEVGLAVPYDLFKKYNCMCFLEVLGL